MMLTNNLTSAERYVVSKHNYINYFCLRSLISCNSVTKIFWKILYGRMKNKFVGVLGIQTVAMDLEDLVCQT